MKHSRVFPSRADDATHDMTHKGRVTREIGYSPARGHCHPSSTEGYTPEKEIAKWFENKKPAQILLATLSAECGLLLKIL